MIIHDTKMIGQSGPGMGWIGQTLCVIDVQHDQRADDPHHERGDVRLTPR